MKFGDVKNHIPEVIYTAVNKFLIKHQVSVGYLLKISECDPEFIKDFIAQNCLIGPFKESSKDKTIKNRKYCISQISRMSKGFFLRWNKSSLEMGFKTDIATEVVLKAEEGIV